MSDGAAMAGFLPGTSMLAIETAGSACSVAVTCGVQVLAAETRTQRHGHAETLLPMVDRVTRAAGIAPRLLRTVAVAIGPGSFTGIRVGLAAAYGIALAAPTVLVGVNSFAAVAAALESRSDPRRVAGLMLVALDSRRADLYVQAFAAGAGGPPRPLAAPAAMLPEALPAFVATIAADAGAGVALTIAGDAAGVAGAALDGRSDIPFQIVTNAEAGALGVAAAARFQLMSGSVDASAPQKLRPLYLRPPDVTPAKPRTRETARIR